MRSLLRFFAIAILLFVSDTAFACYFTSSTQTQINYWSNVCSVNMSGSVTFRQRSAALGYAQEDWELLCDDIGGQHLLLTPTAICPELTATAGMAGPSGAGGSGSGPGAGGSGGGSGAGNGSSSASSCKNACCVGAGGGGPGGPGGSVRGSIVQIDNQTVGESVPIIGTQFSINYTSARALGRTYELARTINFIPGSPGPNFVSRDVTIEIAGRTFLYTCSSGSPCNPAFVWDGLDSSSNLVMGSTLMKVKNLDTHSPPYANEIETTKSIPIGTFFAISAGLGGWTLSPHHFYDIVQKTVFRGDGSHYGTDAKAVSGGYLVASQDGMEIYLFDSAGVHQSTKTSVKGATKYSFTYSGGRLTAITDAYSNATTINYDVSNQPTSIVGPYGQTTTLSVDGNGNLNSIENPNSEEYSMTYYSGTGGLLHTFTKPGGATSTMTYASGGLLIGNSNSAGNSLSLARSGTLTSFTIALTTAEGIASSFSVTNSSPNSYARTNTGADYVSSAFTASHLTAGGLSSSSYVTPSGVTEVQSTTADPRLPSSRYVSYHSINTGGSMLTHSTSRSATLSNPSDMFSVTTLTENRSLNSKNTSVVYDGSTSTYTTTSPEGRLSYVTVDANEKTESIQIASYTPVDFSYDGDGRLSNVSQGVSRTTDIGYNAAGQIETIENALSQVTSFTYDDAGRVLTTTLPDSRVVTYTYDQNGNMTSVTPPSSETHEFQFNGFDFVSKYVAPVGTFFRLDSSTRAISLKMKVGWNRIIEMIASLFSGWFPKAEAAAYSVTVDVETDYAYNDDRQITLITRPTSDTVEYFYSSTTGRLQSIDIPTGTFTFTNSPYVERVNSINSPDGVLQTYGYNGSLVSSVTNTVNASGSVAFTYNSNFFWHTTKINSGTAISYSYDDDRLIEQAGDDTIARYSATGFPQTSAVTNVSENYTYDASFGELASIQGKYSTSTNIYNEVLTRDNLGRISTKTETIAGGSPNVYLYAYDSAGRLTTVLKNSSTYASYTYDSNSNRTSQTINSVTTAATYDEQDRIVSHGLKSYDYDDAGDLTQKSDATTSPASVTTYVYDVMGNLKSITMPNASVYTYLYDGQNRRVVKKVGGTVSKQYLWFDQTRLAAELDDTGAVITEFIYGAKTNTPSYMIKSGTKYKVISDHLGSVVAIANASTGVVAQAITYDEFGRVLSDTSPGFQPLGFAGGLYDSDTGLVRFGARDYDAEIGRWTIKDPILFNGGDTNLYGYVLNDPINLVDPKGTTLEGAVIGGVAGGVLGLILFPGKPAAAAAMCAAGAMAGHIYTESQKVPSIENQNETVIRPDLRSPVIPMPNIPWFRDGRPGGQ